MGDSTVITTKAQLDRLAKGKTIMVDVHMPDDVINIPTTRQGAYEMLEAARVSIGVNLEANYYGGDCVFLNFQREY